MPPLHVEPDQLFLTSRTFWQTNYHLVDQLFTLRLALLRLKNAWYGGNAEDFFAEMDPLLQQLSDQTEDLLTMGLTLSRQADLWDESDQRWQSAFSDLPMSRSGG